jgi:hypothetical protein
VDRRPPDVGGVVAGDDGKAARSGAAVLGEDAVAVAIAGVDVVVIGRAVVDVGEARGSGVSAVRWAAIGKGSLAWVPRGNVAAAAWAPAQELVCRHGEELKPGLSPAERET